MGEGKVLVAVRENQVRKPVNLDFFVLESVEVEEGCVAENAILPEMSVPRHIGRQGNWLTLSVEAGNRICKNFPVGRSNGDQR